MTVATVLVVDDEFGIVELFEAILADEGYRVLTAINGKRGMEVLNKERTDLIFLDYMMPEMDGAATLIKILAEPAYGRIPVVIVSVLPESKVAERCSGYARYMPKSFTVAEVKAVIEQLLGKSADPFC